MFRRDLKIVEPTKNVWWHPNCGVAVIDDQRIAALAGAVTRPPGLADLRSAISMVFVQSR